jgi:ComF family protein
MLIDRILSQLAPHECLGCFAEGALLCADCSRYLIPAPAACYNCGKPTKDARTCIACLPYSDLAAVRAATLYKAITKDLVWQLKFQGTQAAASEIAGQLARFVPRLPEAIIVPVPTATSRVRQRGYDQANLIARELARKTGVAYSAALRRSGQHHQRGSNRDQRTNQLQDAYRVAKPSAIRDRHVILIDDVLTTGSTLEAAAKVAKAAGAKRVSGLVFAKA